LNRVPIALKLHLSALLFSIYINRVSKEELQDFFIFELSGQLGIRMREEIGILKEVMFGITSLISNIYFISLLV